MTSSSHPDLPNLVQAGAKLMDIVDKVNDRVKQVQRVASLMEVARTIENAEVRLWHCGYWLQALRCCRITVS